MAGADGGRGYGATVAAAFDALTIAHRRAATVGLTGGPLGSPDDVVRYLVAVQSQDFGPACWSVAHRSAGTVRRTEITELVNDGGLLRTHVLRPTWHFVLPEDIGWLLDLTGPRVQAFNASYYRREGLDGATLDRATAVIAEALGGRPLTRKEIAVALGDAGIAEAGLRGTLILMNAELDGVICSGARPGKQHTYTRLADRAPDTKRLSRDEAVAELVVRYFSSHGPATVHDMSWWASLTLADIRAGIEAAGDALQAMEFDGMTFYAAPEVRNGAGPRTRLLQSYDEYVVGYSRSKWLLDPTGSAKVGFEDRAVPNLVIVRDAAVIGGWRVTEKAASLLIDAALHAEPSAAVIAELQDAADSYGAYVGKPAELVPRVL